jgi:hypothetical protein
MPKKQQIGRLAVRTEGQFVNAYYVMPHTMEGALMLFGVSRAAAEYPGVRDKVIELGKAIVTSILHDITGEVAQWPDAPTPAPEHERAGNS